MCNAAGLRPVKSAARVGVQRGEAAWKFAKRIPSAASFSRFGVRTKSLFDRGTASSICTEDETQPCASPRMTTKFGRAESAARAASETLSKASKAPTATGNRLVFIGPVFLSRPWEKVKRDCFTAVRSGSAH